MSLLSLDHAVNWEAISAIGQTDKGQVQHLAAGTKEMKTRITFMLAGLTTLAFTVTRAFAVEGGPANFGMITPFAGVIHEPGLAVAT